MRHHLFLSSLFLLSMTAYADDAQENDTSSEHGLVVEQNALHQQNSMNPLPRNKRSVIKTSNPQQEISSLQAQVKELQNQVEDLDNKVSALKKTENKEVITPSGRPEVSNGVNLYLTGDYLYWIAQETGLNYAFKTGFLPLSFTPQGEGEDHYPQFSFDPGFRIGLGWNWPHDGWDLCAQWTRFHTAASDHTETTSTKVVLPAFANPEAAVFPFAKAHAHIRIQLNQIDTDLGREFYVSKWLTLKPTLGIRTLWIDQRYTATYEGAITTNASPYNQMIFINDSFGVGLKAGLSTQWELGWGFSFFGIGDFALVYDRFEVERQSTFITAGPSPATVTSSAKDDFYIGRCVADLSLGLRWDYLLAHDRIHVALQAGWEEHLFFGQNQMYYLEPFQGIRDTFNKDLTTQGLGLSARMDF